MQTVYIGNTLINDVMLGAQRMDDVIARKYPLTIDYLIVAGGGAGGTSVEGGRGGGNGGAGGLLSGSLIVNPNQTPLSISAVGDGGVGTSTKGSNGGNTTFNGITATGGGAGGSAGGGSSSGNNGGSGGGAASSVGTAGTGIAGQGFAGGGAPAGTTAGGGGGGGAAGAGGFGFQPFNGAMWIDGIFYSSGGSGATTPNRGHGGAPSVVGNKNGSSGIVKIRYAGPPQATGGTITESGGFTFHTFTTSGTFTY